MAREQRLPVYYRYKGKVYESYFCPKYAAVESGGQLVAPTRAAQDALLQAKVYDFWSGSGWQTWRLSRNVKIGEVQFRAGTPIGQLRPALGIPIPQYERHAPATPRTSPSPDLTATVQEPAPKPIKKKAKSRRGSLVVPKPDKETEARAVRVVTKDYTKRGWKVRSVEKDRCGYDLVCTQGRLTEHVEVKGSQGRRGLFYITAKEHRTARTDKRFVLYLVNLAKSSRPVVRHWRGRELLKAFRFTPMEYLARIRRE